MSPGASGPSNCPICLLLPVAGEIVVDSEEGKGSTFTVQLPAEVINPKHQSSPADPEVLKSIASASKEASTILVIDDDPTIQDLMQRFLGKEGFQTFVAANGEEGVRLAKEIRPDAITLDVMMPSMDGWSVLSALKADPDLADIPVIMLTIVNNQSMGYALGASDYLTKPIDRDRLLTILHKYQCASPTSLLLVVEDDNTNRQMLRRLLEKQGFTVTEAQNGRAALAQITKRQPDLILLDLMMPEMDGFELVSQLQNHEQWQTIPIVVITAKDINPEDRIRLNGCVEKILQKGAYSQEELLAQVRNLVSVVAKGTIS